MQLQLRLGMHSHGRSGAALGGACAAIGCSAAAAAAAAAAGLLQRQLDRLLKGLWRLRPCRQQQDCVAGKHSAGHCDWRGMLAGRGVRNRNR